MMTTLEIHTFLQQKFPDAGIIIEETVPEPSIRVPGEVLVPVAQFLRNDPQTAFNCLMCLSGLETEDELISVYHLYSMEHNHKCILKCGGSKESEVTVPSVSSIWPTAEWHERESYDLIGIKYSSHPDFRRILCPDDWEGHPLRKDYVPQTRWHEIPLTILQTNPTTEDEKS